VLERRSIEVARYFRSVIAMDEWREGEKEMLRFGRPRVLSEVELVNRESVENGRCICLVTYGEWPSQKPQRYFFRNER
jgi:hypothetical protein